MAQSKEQTQELKQAGKASSKVGMQEFIELLNSPGRLAWLNFSTGLVRGIGGVVGAALAIVLIGAAVTYLGALPYIGQFINKIAAAASITTTGQ